MPFDHMDKMLGGIAIRCGKCDEVLAYLHVDRSNYIGDSVSRWITMSGPTIFGKGRDVVRLRCDGCDTRRPDITVRALRSRRLRREPLVV